MEKMTKKAERKILDSIQTTCDYVSDGMSPTESVIKVARDESLSKNFINLVCTGYNTGATTFQREKSAKVLEKLAEFPMADAQAVISDLYPSKILTPAEEKSAGAVSSEYSLPPAQNRVKAASDLEKLRGVKLDYGLKSPEPYEGDRTIKMASAFNKSTGIKQKVDRERHKYSAAQDQLLLALGSFGDAMKRSSNDEWDRVNFAARQRYGQAGGDVVDYGVLRAKTSTGRLPGHPTGQTPKFASAISWDVAPYSLLAKCVDAAKEVKAAEHAYRDFKKEAQTEVDELLAPFCPQSEPKTAGFMTSLMGSQAARSISQATNPISSKDKIINNMADDLSDPEHENELRTIQAQTMLQDFLNNDEIIAGYDPDEVMTAYNEISQLSPRASTQPAVIRPLLRKRLTQGAMEPFEAAEMAGIEKTISESQNPRLPMNTDNESKQSNVLNKYRNPILG